MDFYWFRKFAKMILYSMIAVIILAAIFVFIIIESGNKVVEDRLSDIEILAASDNCLSEASYTNFQKLLTDCDSGWIKFNTELSDKKPADAITIKKYNINSKKPEGDNLIGFDKATQEGEPIFVQIIGHVKLSVPGWTSEIDYPVTKNYIVTGRRFYKDKAATQGSVS